MLPDYKSFFFTKVALYLLLYICHLGTCFASGHYSPVGGQTLVDFIWAVGSPGGSLGFDYEMEVPSLGSSSLGHMPFVVLIFFLVTCYIHMYLHLFVLMIEQLVCENFVCMAIKIFWLDLTWLDLTLGNTLSHLMPLSLSSGFNCSSFLYIDIFDLYIVT